MRIVWTRRYLIELAAIGDHAARDSPRAAAKLVNDIHSKTAELVAANPEGCPAVRLLGFDEMRVEAELGGLPDRLPHLRLPHAAAVTAGFAARPLRKSAARWACEAAVKIARLSFFSTFSQWPM